MFILIIRSEGIREKKTIVMILSDSKTWKNKKKKKKPQKFHETAESPANNTWEKNSDTTTSVQDLRVSKDLQ